MIDANRLRQRIDIDTAMLSVCTEPACATIIFGSGTCVVHDPPRSPGQAESVGRTRVSPVDARQPEPIES